MEKNQLLKISILAITSLQLSAAELIKVDGNNFEFLLPKVNNNDLKLKKNNIQLKRANTVKLPNGAKKHKYIQIYKGVPVFSNHLSNTEINQKYFNWHGQYLNKIEKDLPSIKPKLTKRDVLDKVLVQMSINEDQISNKQIKLVIKQNRYSLKANLIYWISFIHQDNQKISRPNLMIDANTGTLIKKWNGLTTRKGIGPGGNKKTGKYYYGKDFDYLALNDACAMKTDNVSTFNMNHQYFEGRLFKFQCPENTYQEINGAYSPLNDAHYFGNIIFDMYRKWYNTRPLEGRLKLRVHYGRRYENAFWDGVQMTFGDGGRDFYPFTGLDIVAHEVSHGVTEQNSNLIYDEQPGGINESFSDMAGEVAKLYMYRKTGTKNDWLVGETILKDKPGEALRYFDHPSKDGESIEHTKDYYEGIDVHYSSGIYNKAFYTLANKPKWNTRKAFRVFLLANKIYWQSDASFDSAACGVKKAGEDYGYDLSDIVDSFNTVGVNANCH